MSSGLRLPTASEIGPTTSWPRASPMMNVVSDSWICGAVVPSSRAIEGNAGRYMSTESGPRVQRAPSKPTSFSLLGPRVAVVMVEWLSCS